MNPFHKGELEVQRLTGEQELASGLSSLIQETVMPRALNFVRQQSVIWIGIEDQDNLLWAFPLFGSPGFINPNKGELIEIHLSKKLSIPDEWFNYLEKGKLISCLVIDLSTRRRLRINGRIIEFSKDIIQITVFQSYPNCPKYIRKRKLTNMPDLNQFQFISFGTVLNTHLEDIISQSDTAFVASIGPNGTDVSHRGGSSGFIKYELDNKIVVPDYKGNSMFNTLGNFKENPFGGLTIIDFNQGYFLQISGKVNIFLNKDQTNISTGGTSRFWVLTILKWQLFQLQNNITWENQDFSPFNP